MDVKHEFDQQMQRLERLKGRESRDQCLLVFAIILRWLNEHGHGKIELNAIDHKFSTKIHSHTILSAN